VAEAEGWERRPDATIIFGAPRVADRDLNSWWQSHGLCRKLLRVNAYNDAIHWFPFKKMWRWWTLAADMMGCIAHVGKCQSPADALLSDEESVTFSDTYRWMHVCRESEFIVPAAMQGVNEHLSEFSPFGGILSHFMHNCLFGYGYGVMHGGVADRDAHCGIGPSMCPTFQ